MRINWLWAAFFFPSAGFAVEINTAFLQGTTDIPSVLKDGVNYPAGQYYLDIMLNGSRTGRTALTISPEEENVGQLCLSPEWLQSAGIFFQPEIYAETFDKDRGCYVLGHRDGTQLNLSMGAQTLDFVIPQAWMSEKNDATRWDYGINGLRLTYNGNFNKNVQTRSNQGFQDDSLNAWGNFNASLNLGNWVVSSDMTGSRNAWGSEFTTNNLSLSTAISEIKGDLQLGRSTTRTELFSDFGFYGAAVRSNSNMRSRQTRGYAPVITGVASSTSRITVSQGGYSIYSQVVPPGPWKLDDISPTSNGNLVVAVEDNAGHKTLTEYPVATLPSLLRPGDYAYNIAVGQRDDSNRLDDAFSSGNGTFALISFDRGLPKTTLHMATIVHDQYQAAGFGLTQPLGDWGALAASVNAARSGYDDGSHRQGVSTTLKYAKSLTDRTDIQLLTYRYQSPGYTEFANWRANERYRRPGYILDEQSGQYEYRYSYFNGREKARYEARVNHRLDNAYFSGSFWQQSHWEGGRNVFGANVSASTTVLDGVAVYLNSNWSRSAWTNQDDYTVSLGVSIPFTLGGVHHYSSNSVGYNRDSGATFNTSASAMLNDRLNYSVNAGTDKHSNHTAGASASYAFDRIQTGGAVSQSRDTTTVSGNLSGSVIATAETGLLLTKESSDTVAVLKIKDTPGVTFNGSLPTNSSGSTVVHLAGYNSSTISINPENVPDSAELLNTSFEVVPTEKSIIYREFGYQHVQRYIVRARDAHGNILTGGSATTEQGLDAGYISRNGVLLMNLLATPQMITVTHSSSTTCHFSASSLKAGVNTVQEVRCE